jgi:hypothetical protein
MTTFLTLECQLRAETDQNAIETLLRKGWIETPQPQYDPSTETCAWENCQWVVAPIIIPVPQQIAFWAFRVQLKLINKFDDVQNLIDNLSEPNKTIISTQWEYGNFLQINDLLTLLIIQNNILTFDEMEDVFKEVATFSSTL